MPELGEVNGTVTLDGEPLKGVLILFKPDVGRPAVCTTDDEGKYKLEYLHDETGTKVGPNTVSFEWPIGASGPAIPAMYGVNSKEKVEVGASGNTFDFDLESSPKTPKSSVPAAE